MKKPADPDVEAALAVLAKIPTVDDPDAAEEEALNDLRRMRDEDAAARDALIAAVRDDLLAGRIGRREAVERIGLNGWSRICLSLTDDELRRVLGDDQ